MRHILFIAAIIASIASACKGNRQASEDLRDAELALADGDMTVARSVADKLLGPSAIETLSATELARLSMVYMQMAEEENDNTALVATAADLYRRACRENADSAKAYYLSLSASDETLASQLFHIVAATDSAGVIPAEVLLADTIPSDSLL